MLDGLDDIDWNALTHAYGPAADVPEQIRALRSREREVRRAAFLALYGNLFHQGTRYQASAHAAPFLLELLADPATPDRRDLLRLLTSLAIGFDESWLPAGFPVSELRHSAAGGEELLRAGPQTTAADSETGPPWYHSLDEEQGERLLAWFDLAVYDAVRAGVPVLRAVLTDAADDEMRAAAAYALAWFPEEANGSLPALAPVAAGGTAAVRAIAAVAIGLAGSAPDAVLVESLLGASEPVVRWGGGVALARLLGPSAGPRVAEELLAWAGGETGPDADVPFLDGDLAGYAGLALAQLGEGEAGRSFVALLERLRAVSGTEALNVVREALRRAFPEGRIAAGTPFAALDDQQRRLVETLAGSPGAWRLRGLLFGNFTLTVSAYGLPRDPDRMRVYALGVGT